MSNPVEWIVSSFLACAIEEAIKKSNCNKAGGPNDGITAEVYKALIKIVAPVLKEIFNSVIRNETVPPSWRKGTIVNIHKGGTRLDISNYRGIMLLAITGKMFNWIMASRITKYVQKKGVLCNRQNGFLYLRGTLGPAFSFCEVVVDMLNTNKKPYAFYLDLSKAFDCIDRKIIYKNLRKAGIPRRGNV